MSDINGPFSILVEDYSGLTITYVIPDKETRWYSNVPGYDGTVMMKGDGTTSLEDLPRHLCPHNTQENPSYGEALSAGELFLDGTDSFVSSDNRDSVVDVVDYIPAVETLDGVDYEPAESKWAGDRGTYGFFGEYENEANIINRVDNINCDSSNEGDWVRVEATATISSSATTSTVISFSALSNKGFIGVDVRKGNTDTTMFVLSSSKGEVTITWASKTATLSLGTDLDYTFISDEIVRLNFIGASAGGINISCYPRVWASTTSGDYSYFRNTMVADLSYPVPYHPGTHQAAKLQYDIDWATSDTWTIEGWLASDSTEDPAFSPALGIGSLASSGTGHGVSVIRRGGDDSFRIRLWNGSSLVDITTANSGAYHHFKIIYSSGTITGYWDGGSGTSHTGFDVADFPKLLYVGYSDTDQFDGFIQDLRIYAGSDVTTTHYDNALPWYNPNKTYGKSALWSIDDKGHFSGQFDNAGRIIEDYELDSQHVVKYDTGFMINRGVGASPGTYVEAFIGDTAEVTGAADYATFGRWE